MKIKIFSALSEFDCSSDILTVGTHNGTFHEDELVAIAILFLLKGSDKVWVVRTRDEKILNKCDICVDVGGGTFDHHMSGFNLQRSNGIKYASAGLVWNVFGKELIKSFQSQYFSGYEINLRSVFETFDREVISIVDCVDNGIPYDGVNLFSFVPAYRPLWFQTSSNEFNEQFRKALVVTLSVLKEQLIACMAKVLSNKILWDNWMDYDLFHDWILEIPSQTIDWVDTIIDFNNSTPCDFARVNFVMFPYPNGGWAAQCVPPSHEDKFGQRIPFPRAWAGHTNDLPAITGVATATFCHNGCFFVRAKDKDDVTRLCLIATNQAQES